MFDLEALNNQLVRAAGLQPVKQGYFAYHKKGVPIVNSLGETEDVEWRITDIEFVADRDGCITIHEEPQVKRNKENEVVGKAPYVIGGDTAGSGEDYFTGKVINNLTGRTAATLRRQKMDEDLYAEQMYCLGMYYHEALIGIETNYSRHPMRVLQKKYSYPNLYMRQRLDKLTDKTEDDLQTPRSDKSR